MEDVTLWFEKFEKGSGYQELQKHPIAYFCAEYALTSDLQIYAGGLGILAGDFIREAADRQLPVVGIGLYYHDGYETLHDVDPRGYIDVPHVHSSPENFGLSPLLDSNGNKIVVSVPIQDRDVKACVWKWQIKNVIVYLLDTDIEGNQELDKKITDHLYVVDKETRFKQEILLGIGGSRLLTQLEINPHIYHMNEGHSALLSLEVIFEEMASHHVSFEEAKDVVGKSIVFTNHTLLVSGNDVFSSDLVSLTLSRYSQDHGIPIEKIIELGLVQDSSSFSMTMLALRIAGRVNAVSMLHAEKAKEIWHDHPLTPVTNGIHVPTWNAIADTTNIWGSHQENKKELLRKIREFSEITWKEDELLIGWARRFVEYKRPLALFEDIGRLKQVALSDKPVHIVVAGRLHPSDEMGNKLLEQLRHLAENELKGILVYFPDYSLENAKLLVAGCDVWLNTPVVGFEACGTSGMKAALNGSLPCSTKDGWVYEADLSACGWVLDSDHITQSLLTTICDRITPEYYSRDEDGVSKSWIARMKQARTLITGRFSTTRMVKEYIEKLYLPA